MARVFITGSADGLGFLAARTLLDEGHRVVVHVRSSGRLDAVAPLVSNGAEVVVGDLAVLEQMHAVAEQVNALGTMDAVIHNAGVYEQPGLLAVNVVAPWVLSSRLTRPKRVVVLSSGMHRGGRPALEGVDWSGARATASYSDSKLFVTALTLALAARWREVFCNAVDPGWVPTKMGGPNAPDDLRLGHLTQEWLATSDAPAARTSGGYWRHQQRSEPHAAAKDPAFQQRLFVALERASGVRVE